jgi:hypothetical protein
MFDTVQPASGRTVSNIYAIAQLVLVQALLNSGEGFTIDKYKSRHSNKRENNRKPI